MDELEGASGVSCVCGEINTRHWPVHGQDEEHPSPVAFEWRDSKPIPMDVGLPCGEDR